MSTSNDGSESVDQFLARIASLSTKQGTEEAERSRRMEEEMLQAKKERQARRAERARSISPVKTGPAASRSFAPLDSISTQSVNTPPSLSAQTLPQTTSRPTTANVRPRSQSPPTSSATDAPRPLPPLPTAKPAPLSFSSTNTTTLGRSGTLSWQQRPLSREFGSIRSRPLSKPGASIHASDTSPRPPSPEKEQEQISRADIAASLGAKDPSWFRQTQDSGRGLAAFRKNDNHDDTFGSHSSPSVRLPGMSAQGTALASRSPSAEPVRESIKAGATSPTNGVSRTSPEPERNAPARNEQPAISPSPINKLSGLDVPTLRPHDHLTLDDDQSLGRSPSILSTSGRPPSPTKGLGGFVQSAMLKRSDSVNKRWSVQANAGLKRGDSVAGNRPKSVIAQTSPLSHSHARGGLQESQVEVHSRSALTSESDHSLREGSVPKSGILTSNENTKNQDTLVEKKPDDPKQDSTHNSAVRPTTPTNTQDTALARSPSKTLEARRWSPTKASWLESALSKPESPKPSLVRPETPSWKADLQRSKVEKEAKTKEKIETAVSKSQEAEASDDAPTPNLPHKSPGAVLLSRALPTPMSNNIKTREPPSKPPALRQSQTTQPAITALPTSELTTPDKARSLLQNNVTSEPASIKQISTRDAFDSHAKAELGKSIPVTKPKPQTPPKIDLRANLKSRSAGSTNTGTEEPEFKSVFGKLKPAQTQNYVAPDELKGNILRGKAALSLTDGPQKTKHTDELKESILQQKEAMKAGHSRSDSQNQRSLSPEKPPSEIPEALQRRKTLHKTSPSKDTSGLSLATELSKPFSLARTDFRKPSPSLPPKKLLNPIIPTKSNTTPSTNTAELEVEDASPSMITAPSSGVTMTEEPGMISQIENASPNTATKKPVLTNLNDEIKGGLSTSSKLASRLNPSLASLISRGPSPKPPVGVKTTTADSLKADTEPRRAGGDAIEAEDAGTLVHMTKGRAKGPKRRAPKAEKGSNQTSPVDNAKAVSKVASLPRNLPAQGKESSPKPSSPQHTRPVAANENITKSAQQLKPASGKAPEHLPGNTFTAANSAGGVSTPAKANLEKPKPVVATKSPDLRKISNPTSQPKMNDPQTPAKPSPSKIFDIATDKTKSSDMLIAPKVEEVDNARKQQGSPMPLTPSKSKINSPMLPKSSGDILSKAPILQPSPKLAGVGVDRKAQLRKESATSEPVLSPDNDRASLSKGRTTAKSTALSNVKSSNAQVLLEEFFGNLPKSTDRVEFDTEGFLASQDSQIEKIKTISKQIWQVSGDGKKSVMPLQQEHILFEDCMYLCVHTYQTDNSNKSSDAYLWCGDSVPDAAVDDAQLFCKKVARENNAKLEVVKQSKENSNFFQALGGIVITRKNKDTATYMLCGRRHLGHVAFDEVELKPSSLCSGFPFLISAKFGKLYLWKGHGSNADEVGAARLIGMDLGLTGEIEEVSEGQEPRAFWEAFPSGRGKQEFQPSPMWSIKSADEHRGFPCKLYRVERGRPKSSGGFWGLRSASPPKTSNKASLEEIKPFCQNDLDHNSTHILDAYANIYVFPGTSTKSKPEDFVTALHIAQDIALLTPSVQDRSLLPVCDIIFGEPPADFRAAFRKWVPQRNINWSKGSESIDVAEAISLLA